MRLRPREIAGLALVVASYVAFVPGITHPLVTLTANFSLLGRDMEVFRETRSLLGMIDALHDSGNDFVAGLVLLFGVVIPVTKGLLLVAAPLIPRASARRGVGGFAQAITKWAMNDVFVVAVYVAFLSAKATDNLDADLGRGFYWFTTYVLLSLLSLPFLGQAPPPLRDATPGPRPGEGGPTPHA